MKSLPLRAAGQPNLCPRRHRPCYPTSPHRPHDKAKLEGRCSLRFASGWPRTASSPGARTCGAFPQVDGEYIAGTEDVLDFYAEAPDPERPLVCFDESPVQLIGEVRQPIPAERQLERRDYEYRRNATVNLFVISIRIAPGAGQGYRKAHNAVIESRRVNLGSSRDFGCLWAVAQPPLGLNSLLLARQPIRRVPVELLGVAVPPEAGVFAPTVRKRRAGGLYRSCSTIRLRFRSSGSRDGEPGRGAP
jgi:hypothetical protein